MFYPRLHENISVSFYFLLLSSVSFTTSLHENPKNDQFLVEKTEKSS